MGPTLPTGTVTFLFTDVEGSTKLWEQHPERMREALIRHDALIEEGVGEHAGVVVRPRGEGDSRFAVFSRPSDAVAAACAIGQSLFAEPWQTPTPLRVRMALHTGEADLRGGDYYGSAANRCARLRALAHGGQTLLSSATAQLARDVLPEGACLRDLGLHRLRDLERPENVFQLVIPGLPADFPPLKSLEAFPNNLPIQLTSFVGREREMAEVKRLLTTTHLLTLTGAGGAGKTRLSLQAAADLLESYPDGAWLVELASLSDPALVDQSVASALGVKEEPGLTLLTTLTNYLRTRHLLLILDNCEHLIGTCAQVAETLLRACPGLKILATSREALGISGETAWRVPSLSLPDPKHLPAGADLSSALTMYEAVRLFIDRAVAVQPTFAVTNRNAPAVAQICHRLDGIPLAIELAAARVKVLSVEQIAARLDDRFRLLTGGSRTALPRQQTLRTLIDWSYDLLSDGERALLRRLSAFAGGWTLDAAEAACVGDGIEAYEVLDLLTQLANKSLVVVESEEARYRLLETIRHYARDKLMESGEAGAVRGRHLDFFLNLAEEAEPELIGADQAVWLNRLEVEHDNMRAALEWGKAIEGGSEGGMLHEAPLRLVGALWRFWYLRGYLSEGRGWLEMALSESSGASASLRAKALVGAGLLAHSQGDRKRAVELCEESLALYRELEDKKGIAASLNTLGLLAQYQGDYDRAVVLLEESLALSRELGDKAGIASALQRLSGVVFMIRGDYKRASVLYEESLALHRELKDKGGISVSLRFLGLGAFIHGDYDRGTALLEESLALSRELGDKGGAAQSLLLLGFTAEYGGDRDRAAELWEESAALYNEVGNRWGIAGSLCNLGLIALRRGDYSRAASLCKESLTLSMEMKNKMNVGRCLAILGGVAEEKGQLERAARLLGAGEAQHEATGFTALAPSPYYPPDYDRSVAAVRAGLVLERGEGLGEEAFTKAWEEGRKMAMEEAIKLAMMT
jgi:predicted ATPase/class 3 adenylate cyclase